MKGLFTLWFLVRIRVNCHEETSFNPDISSYGTPASTISILAVIYRTFRLRYETTKSSHADQLAKTVPDATVVSELLRYFLFLSMD